MEAEQPVAAPLEQPAACNCAVDLLVGEGEVPQDPAPSELAKVRAFSPVRQLDMALHGQRLLGDPVCSVSDPEEMACLLGEVLAAL